MTDGFDCDLIVASFGQKLLLSIFLLNHALLHSYRDVYDVIDFKVSRQEGLDSGLLIHSEHVGDHESLPPAHLLALNVRRLILLIRRLAQKFADLMEESVLVTKFIPGLDAENQVEATLTGQELRQVDRVRRTSSRLSSPTRVATESTRESLFDAVVAYNSSW